MSITTVENPMVELAESNQDAWSKSLLDSLNEMRMNSSLCDVVISSQDNVNFNVHSAVLGAGSEFFRKLLVQPKQSASGIIIKLEKNQSLTEKIVEFLYTGRTIASFDELEELMSMAEGYEMKSLHQLCSSHLELIQASSQIEVLQEVAVLPSPIKVTKQESPSKNNSLLKAGALEETEENVEEMAASSIINELPNAEENDGDTTMVTISQDQLLPCKYCDFIFYDANDLENHQKEAHEGEVLTIQKQKEPVTNRYQISNGQDMQMMEVVTFADMTDVDVIEALNSVSKTPEPSLMYLPGNYRRTPRVTGGPKKTWRDYRYKCSYCDKEFTSASRMRGHEALHSGEKRHQCNLCGQKFIQIEYLREHVSMHTSEKPFECNVCSQKFRLQRHLKKHQQIHDPHKPFKCDMCDASFRKPEPLKQHIMKHTGEKPHQCNICLKQFRCIQGYNHHMKALHGEDAPFRCGFCSVGFKRTVDLERHQDVCQKAHDKRSLLCTDCGLYFKSKATLQRHMRFKHNKTQTSFSQTQSGGSGQSGLKKEVSQLESTVLSINPTEGNVTQDLHKSDAAVIKEESGNPNRGFETLLEVMQGQEESSHGQVLQVEEENVVQENVDMINNQICQEESSHGQVLQVEEENVVQENVDMINNQIDLSVQEDMMQG